MTPLSPPLPPPPPPQWQDRHLQMLLPLPLPGPSRRGRGATTRPVPPTRPRSRPRDPSSPRQPPSWHLARAATPQGGIDSAGGSAGGTKNGRSFLSRFFFVIFGGLLINFAALFNFWEHDCFVCGLIDFYIEQLFALIFGRCLLSRDLRAQLVDREVLGRARPSSSDWPNCWHDLVGWGHYYCAS